MSLETASTSLPVLALPADILFPATQLTVNLPRALINPLSCLIRDAADSDAPPLVAAVPSLEPIGNAKELDSIGLYEWGCVARVIRLTKPSLFNPSYCTVTLGGISRVRLQAPYPPSSKLSSLPLHPVNYPPQNKSSLSEPAAETFRACALKFLERSEAGSKNKTSSVGNRVDWRRMTVVVEEAEVDRLPWVSDILVAVTPSLPWSDRLALLAAYQPDERLRLASTSFSKHISITEVSQKINSAVDESLSKQQKEYYLRQQLYAIQKELASLHKSGKQGEAGDREGKSELDEDGGDEGAFMAELKKKIEAMERDSEERTMAVREYQRLKRIPATSVEHGVIRTYLEWLTSLPWPNTAKDQNQSIEVLKDPNFLSHAREQLEADHFGLEKIKKRLIEHMAVIRLKALNASAEQEKEGLSQQQVAESSDVGRSLAIPDGLPQGAGNSVDTGATQHPPTAKKPKSIKTKGPILLLVGPPGCGKTSIAASLARALDRPFQRISLGGVRDEAEIRGHRRTYVASGPGAIVTALSKAKRLDPVILLDEIDKVGRGSYQGDPSAALLEVLDPEQNVSFKDHYINVPLDLSQVLFVATANSLDTVSDPLLDRCEVIQLPGYTYDEKNHIARRFLLPKQLEANGLPPNHISLTDAAYTHVTSYYTREAGVRSLERCLGAIARSKAVEWAEFVDAEKKGETVDYQNVVDAEDLEKFLGIARWDPLEREREERRGLVYGLVVSGMGEGGVLPVESVMTPGTGKLRLTGSLGDVIRESGEIALSWVKSNAFALGITPSLSQDPLKVPEPIDIHLHLPSGAIKKDGPSAGVAYICAFVSLLTGFTVPSNIAMTGETTLRGKVTAVGGIKEKVLGAHREGIKKLILPRTNRKDVEYDVPPEIHLDMQFMYVGRVEEALEAAFGRRVFDPSRAVMESRL